MEYKKPMEVFKFVLDIHRKKLEEVEDKKEFLDIIEGDFLIDLKRLLNNG